MRIFEEFFDDIDIEISEENVLEDNNHYTFFQLTMDMPLNNSTKTYIEDVIMRIRKMDYIFKDMTFVSNEETKLMYIITRRGRGDWKDYTHCSLEELFSVMRNAINDKKILDSENGLFSTITIVFNLCFTPNYVEFSVFQKDIFKFVHYGLYKVGVDNRFFLYENGKKKDSFYKDPLFNGYDNQMIVSLYNSIMSTHLTIEDVKKYRSNFYKKPLYNINDEVVRKLIGMHNYPDNRFAYKFDLCGYNSNLEMFTANQIYDIVLRLYPVNDDHKKVSKIIEYIKLLAQIVKERATYKTDIKINFYIYVDEPDDVIFDMKPVSSLIDITDHNINGVKELTLCFVDDDGNRIRVGRIKALNQPKGYARAKCSYPKYRQYLKH